LNLPPETRYAIREFIPEDLGSVRALFREYAVIVASGICFSSFERELAELPGCYKPLLLAFAGDRLAGCAALKHLDSTSAEMKRLYVRPEFQSLGLGRELTERIIAEARSRGYRFLRLDTLPYLDRAIAMYRRRGFYEIPRYADNPAAAICFELPISR
jgi:ribosomal protein S18 acetylase RimI-like enzyme